MLCCLYHLGSRLNPIPFTIVDTAKGRATLAARSFAIGDPVLVKPPFLTWDATNSDAKFLRASGAQLARRYSLAHAPLSSPTPRVAALRRAAAISAASPAPAPPAEVAEPVLPPRLAKNQMQAAAAAAA